MTYVKKTTNFTCINFSLEIKLPNIHNKKQEKKKTIFIFRLALF